MVIKDKGSPPDSEDDDVSAYQQLYSQTVIQATAGLLPAATSQTFIWKITITHVEEVWYEYDCSASRQLNSTHKSLTYSIK